MYQADFKALKVTSGVKTGFTVCTLYCCLLEQKSMDPIRERLKKHKTSNFV